MKAARRVHVELLQRAERAEQSEALIKVQVLDGLYGPKRVAKLLERYEEKEAHLAEAVRLLEEVMKWESNAPGSQQRRWGAIQQDVDKFLSSTPADRLAKVRAMERVVEAAQELCAIAMNLTPAQRWGAEGAAVEQVARIHIAEALAALEKLK